MVQKSPVSTLNSSPTDFQQIENSSITQENFKQVNRLFKVLGQDPFGISTTNKLDVGSIYYAEQHTLNSDCDETFEESEIENTSPDKKARSLSDDLRVSFDKNFFTARSISGSDDGPFPPKESIKPNPLDILRKSGPEVLTLFSLVLHLEGYQIAESILREAMAFLEESKIDSILDTLVSNGFIEKRVYFESVVFYIDQQIRRDLRGQLSESERMEAQSILYDYFVDPKKPFTAFISQTNVSHIEQFCDLIEPVKAFKLLSHLTKVNNYFLSKKYIVEASIFLNRLDFRGAIESYNKALRDDSSCSTRLHIFTELGRTYEAYADLLLLRNSDEVRSKLDLASKYYEKALSFGWDFTDLSSLKPEDLVLCARLNSIQQPIKSKVSFECFQKALEMSRLPKNALPNLDILVELAVIYRSFRPFEEAIDFYRSILGAIRRSSESRGSDEVILLTLLKEAYLSTNQIKHANDCFYEIAAIKKKIDKLSCSAAIFFEKIALTAHQAEDYCKARKYYSEASEVYQANDKLYFQLNCVERLVEVSLGQNDLRMAAYHCKEAVTLATVLFRNHCHPKVVHLREKLIWIQKAYLFNFAYRSLLKVMKPVWARIFDLPRIISTPLNKLFSAFVFCLKTVLHLLKAFQRQISSS